ncbi:MAG: alanine racemase [Oscillospiraceae bacterium]|nr:alanine racemase [Oscillospiraceae bacterium]
MLQYRKRAWAEISLDALAHNVQVIQNQLSEHTEFCAVVKADAYGHGEEFICKKLYALGIKFYAVSSFEEAIRVRKWCPEGEILILGYTAPECAPLLAENHIIQTIISENYAKELASYAKSGMKIKCHIKLDTGMGRIGLFAKSQETCLQQIKSILNLSGLQVDCIFTHFAVADEPDFNNQAYTQEQENLIFDIFHKLQKENIFLKHVHCMNSAGICYHNQSKSTLARAGIIMYGLMPNRSLAVPFSLQPVLSLRTRISHIKTIHAGDCVSYGRTYQAKEKRKIATITIGYADGYARLLSNKAEVLVNGIRCAIVGRVCMDQTMIDVTAIPDLKIGTVVTLIGQDGNDCITADELASNYQTIGYEVVCGISKRIPRIFIENSCMIHEDSLI